MTRRHLIVLLILALVGTMGFAQPTEVGDFLTFESLQSQFSAGLFDNELGAASSVVEDGSGPGFSDLDADYLFAGLGNLNGATATGTVTSAGGGIIDIDNPLLFGMYRNAEMAWSLFSGIYVDGARVRDVAVTEDAAIQDTSITANGVTTNYEWIPGRQTEESVTFENFRIANQYLTMLEAMNAGLYLDLALVGGSKTTTVDETFYDETDNTTIPDPQKQATETQVDTVGRDLFVGLGVPVFLSTDEMSHYLNPQFVYRRNAGASSSTTVEWETFGLPAGTMNVNTQDDSDKDVTTNLELVADYALLLPAMYGENERNGFRIDVSPRMALTTRTDEVNNSTTFRTFDGTTVTDGNTVTVIETRDYQAAWDFGLLAGASHSFYHEIGDGVEFAFEPGAMLGISTTPTDGTRLTREETDNQTVDDTGVNITRTQVVTETVFGARDRTTEVESTLELPVAMKAQPEDWAFGFSISGTPSVQHTMTVAKTYAQDIESTTTTTTTTTGTNDPVVTPDPLVVNEYAVSEPSRNITHAWTFEADYELGVHVALSERAKLDIALTGFLGSILEFNDFTIQAIVAY